MKTRRPYDYEGRDHGRIIQTHKSRAIPGQEIAIQIRLDDKGRFHAKYLDAWYTADHLTKIIETIEGAVKSGGPTSWSYFIQVTASDDSENFYRGSYGRGRAALNLHYRVIRLSNVISGLVQERYGEAKDGTYRLEGEVEVSKDGTLKDDPGRPSRFQERDAGELVPFTLERWRALESIAEALRETGRRLAQVLASGPGAAFLDGVSGAGPALLAAVPVVAPPPEKKRKAGR
jgi:hypothetical protein